MSVSAARSAQMKRLWADPDHRERFLKSLAVAADKTRHLDKRTLAERNIRVSRALRSKRAGKT